MAVNEGQIIVNGKPITIGPMTGVTEKRSQIEGGGEIVRTWNGAAVSTARAAFWRWAISISFEGIIPPLMETIWRGQMVTLESSIEVVLDGYVDLAVTPRFAPPLTPGTRMWDPVEGSISFMDGMGEIESDGTNALPDGYTADMITHTLFRPRLPCLVTNGFDASLLVDRVDYSGEITMEEV